MGFDVIVLGSLHMDIMVSAPDRPRRGETLAGHAWSLKPGGKGGNQAVEVALAGARTAMIGAVGDDDFGRALLQNLEVHGVDKSGVAVRKDAGSGISVAIIDSGGDYGAVIVSGQTFCLMQIAPRPLVLCLRTRAGCFCSTKCQTKPTYRLHAWRGVSARRRSSTPRRRVRLRRLSRASSISLWSTRSRRRQWARPPSTRSSLPPKPPAACCDLPTQPSSPLAPLGPRSRHGPGEARRSPAMQSTSSRRTVPAIASSDRSQHGSRTGRTWRKLRVMRTRLPPFVSHRQRGVAASRMRHPSAPC